MASELNLGSIDATPYKDFSGGIEDDYEPSPIGEFMARGISAENGKDGTRVATYAHRIARDRIDRITGYTGRFSHTREDEDDDEHIPETFLGDMTKSLEPRHNMTRCARCRALIIWDFVNDLGFHDPKRVTDEILCSICRKAVEEEKSIQLEPKVEKKTPKMIYSFLTLGNILENRPLPQKRTSFDEFDMSTYITSDHNTEFDAAVYQMNYTTVRNIDYLDSQTRYAQMRDWMVITTSYNTGTGNGDYWYDMSSYQSPHHTMIHVRTATGDEPSTITNNSDTSYFMLSPPTFISDVIQFEIADDDVIQISEV